MLTECHACCSYGSCQQKENAEREQGIKTQRDATGNEHSCQPPHANHVCADFPFEVDDETEDHADQCCQYDASEKHPCVGLCEQEQAGCIAEDGDDVRHMPMLTMADLPSAPFVQPAEEIDAGVRDDDREDQYDGQEVVAIGGGELVGVTEEKHLIRYIQCLRLGKHVMPHEQERPKRGEKGREDDGEHLGKIYDCFVHGGEY